MDHLDGLRYWDFSHDKPYPRQKSFNAGVKIARIFCRLNNVQEPAFFPVTGKSLPFVAHYAKSRAGNYNYAVASVRVFMDSVSDPSSLADNWPGAVEDYTPVGVVAHELGHHVHAHSGRMHSIGSRLARTNEPALTRYGHVGGPLERFAEAFRLFLLNPYLLEELRPRQCAALDELYTRVLLGVSSAEVLS